jgi:hypothetical protein
MKRIIISFCFLFPIIHSYSQGTIQFARWKNDAKGAYSFDSDDYGRSWYGDITFIAGIIDTMPGVRLTFATNGGVSTDVFWDHANNTLLGNDFVNHTYNHEPPDNTPATFSLEVDSGQSIIEKNIPWQKCLFLVFPGGGKYDVPIMNNYIKTRRYIGTNGGSTNPAPYNISNTFSMGMNYYNNNTVAEFNAMVNNAINTGGWSLAASHQIGGVGGGWGPMAADTFINHMKYCWQKVKAGDLWFDGIQHIVKYIGERENFSLQIVTENDTMLEAKFITDTKEINPSTFIDNTAYDEPLTLKGATKFGTAFKFDANPWKGNVIIKYNNSSIKSVIQNSKTIFPKPSLSVDKKFVSVVCDTSSVNIVITANPGAEITSTCLWLVPKKLTITGNGTVSISVAKNMISQIRRGAIVVSYGGVVSKIVAFKQAASDKWLYIISDSVKVVWDAVKSSFYTSANVSWQATTTASWITITNTSGLSSVTVNLTLTPNPDTIKRIGWIKVNNVIGFKDSVKIVQAAKPKDAPLPGAISENAVGLDCYPNPVESILTIGNAGSVSQIQIISVQGTILYSTQIFNESVQINMGEMADGVYILKATLKNGQVINELIIKK